MRRAIASSIAVASLLGTRAARAQGTDPAAAQALFEQAKQLEKQGKVTEACPKLLASLELDPRPGTALNLADCYEKAGQTASAWVRYLEAASIADRAGQVERVKYAKEHAAKLEPMVPRLAITAPSAPRGLEVRRDGVLVEPAVFGTAVPIDPGKHVVEASAPGKKPLHQSIDVPRGPGGIAVELPALEDEPVPTLKPAAKPAPPPPSKREGSLQRTLGFAGVSVGGAGLLLGAVAGGVALGQHSVLTSVCNAGNCLGQEGAVDGYHRAGTIATAGFVAGGILAATGVVLVVTAPGARHSKEAWVAPVVGAGIVGAEGRF